MNYALRDTIPPPAIPTEPPEIPPGPDLDTFTLAKSYFDLKEFDRAAFFARKLTSNLGRFLHLYARFMSAEKKRMDDLTDSVVSPDSTQLSQLRQLRVELQQLHADGQLDAYGLYVYGIVLRKLSLPDLATPVLCEAVAGEPGHWGAWLELSCLVTSRDKLAGLDLPDHWCKQVFLAHTYLELHQDDEAVTYFKQLAELDPYRLDNLDTYSNLLYVKEQRVELAHLAHKTNLIDKYRPETCCVIGNYYSHRSQHEKAVVYFQRALKLNPGYLSALTLMGHEYMEMKNTNAAIQSYRQAIEANRRDYRAWYGLGQTYEILKMHHYCLYYFKQAQELRPSDSRMLVALGESYEKLDKIQDAMKCFWKAHCVGDIEGGIALLRLARLYDRTGDLEQAAAAYNQYIAETEGQGISDRDEQSNAYKYLARYYLNQDMLADAHDCAMKCTEFPDVREDGKSMLKEIASRRAGQSEGMSVLKEGPPRTRPLAGLGIDGSPSGSPRRDLEPVNLNFTP